jgi:hypothetical protein
MDKKDKRTRDKGDVGRCKKQSSKKTYTKKRRNKNKGKKLPKKVVEVIENQPAADATVQVEIADDQPTISTPKKTVSSVNVEDIEINEDLHSEISGFRLIEMSILSDVISLLGCPRCVHTGTLKLNDIFLKKRGFARFLRIQCHNCSFIHEFYTSPDVITSNDPRQRGSHTMEINTRMVYGFRSIGVGFELLSKLCGFINMPTGMSKTSYDNTVNNIKKASKTVAEKSMSDAATDIRKGKETADVGVSVDGSWQRKGFSSTLGVITAISADSGKVLDVSILSKSCKGCTRMQKVAKSDPKRYELWKVSHKCNLNYHGSSPAMETSGTKKIFERSVEKHSLYYTDFYGDGDSKAYAAVKDTYEKNKKEIRKQECIGHYQKRVGCRLRKLKSKTKGLGGRGRLTDAKIDTLQNYFGIALRENVGNLDAMRKGCLASMYHVAGYHNTCPLSTNSWCQSQRDKVNNTNHYKPKGSLPLDVRKAILPTYTDLCKEELLKKCLHGKTQNANESFNATIWNRIPKATHVGLDALSLGVYDAISNFNYGQKASLDTIKSLGIEPGLYMNRSSQSVNQKRKRRSIYKASSPVKKRRKILRHSHTKKNDKITEAEGNVYEAGGF